MNYSRPLLTPELVAAAVVVIPIALVVCVVAAPVVLVGLAHKRVRRCLRKQAP